MQIILMNSVRKLGGPGSVVSVKNGFGRYLVQSGSALRASSKNMEQIEQHKETLAEKHTNLLSSLNKVVALLNERTFIFIKSAGSDGRLFGSVNKRDIASVVLKFLRLEMQEIDFDLDHCHVILAKPIKDLGCYKIKIALHPDLEDFNIVVSVAISEELAAISLKKFLKEEPVKESV